MSDSSESTSSLDWAIVDQQGSIPDDVSTASSVEVVDDEDDDDSYNDHNTPLAGSPQIDMPKFVLRLHSQSAVNVSDTDEEQCDISSQVIKSETSIASIPESLPSGTDLGTCMSPESFTAGQTYRQSSSTARISQEEIEDLCNKIDAVKKVFEPVKDINDVNPDELFGDGKTDTPSHSGETTKKTPRSVEDIQHKESYDGDVSMQSSVSSSYSFLSRDIGTESRSNSELPENVGDNEQQPLLVEELLEHQEPDVEQIGAQKPVEEERVEPENLNDLLQVEQGPNYLQTIVSHFVDYRDIIGWIIGFGSYTGLVVATVVFLSGPANVPVVPKDNIPGSDISALHQHCHGDECSTDAFLLNNPQLMLQKLKDCNHRVKELETSLKAKEDAVDLFITKTDQQKERIDVQKKRISELKNKLKVLEEENEGMKENNDNAVKEWRIKWKNCFNDVDKLEGDKLGLENKLSDLEHKFDRCKKDKTLLETQSSDSCKQARHDLDAVQNSCSHDLNTLQVKCRNDLDNAKQECQVLTDNLKAQYQHVLDNVKSQHQLEMDKLEYKRIDDLQRLQRQSTLNMEKMKKSCNMQHKDDNKDDHSNKFENNERYSTYDEQTKYNAENNGVDDIDDEDDVDDVDEDDVADDVDQDTNDSDTSNDDSDNKPYYNNKWADTVLEMMNMTKHEIENTWNKVKNMSETLWTEHEPTIRNLHQSFTKKMMRLNEKFHEKVSRKLNKWFGRKEQASAKTKRRKHKQNKETVTKLTVEQRLVKLSYVVDAFTAKSFMRTFKTKMSVLEGIQAEFKDIDATKKIPHTPEERIKWKDYILTDDHLKWLRCHQVFWEDFNKVTDTCYKELCCWEVKVAHGDVKACKKYKRKHGMVEDRCFLELPKDNVDADDDDDNDDIEDNWYFERVDDRDYQRNEPDDWFFRRKHKDGSDAPVNNVQNDDDDNDDDGYVYDDDEYFVVGSDNCYPDRCDRP